MNSSILDKNRKSKKVNLEMYKKVSNESYTYFEVHKCRLANQHTVDSVGLPSKHLNNNF